ncbi:hypothetical protein FOL47_005041 [Perkinsus chesapeaki]|uniref:EF-hand domain-containing protein n=1 Tax=Perkinsus chesapeaki TaxID=330153 RepID=A0A7J6LZ92_PERCH|nr:hypothetical protein FOL47_005041 [Perkinsus chesapeaki]
MSVSYIQADTGEAELDQPTTVHVPEAACVRCRELESRLNQELLKRDVARSCISHYRQAIIELQHKLKTVTEQYEEVLAGLGDNNRRSPSVEGPSQQQRSLYERPTMVDTGVDPQEVHPVNGCFLTSPRGLPKSVQTEHSITAFAQGLAYEVATEVGQFLEDKGVGRAVEVQREVSPSKPGKRFCTACGRRATVGVPASTQTEASESGDGTLWPNLSAFLYKAPTKHLPADAWTQTEYTAAGAFHDLVHDVGQMIIQNREEEESETSAEELPASDEEDAPARTVPVNPLREVPRLNIPSAGSKADNKALASGQDDDWDISDDEVDDAEETIPPKKSIHESVKSSTMQSPPKSMPNSSSSSSWGKKWLGALTSGLSVSSLSSGRNHRENSSGVSAEGGGSLSDSMSSTRDPKSSVRGMAEESVQQSVNGVVSLPGAVTAIRDKPHKPAAKVAAEHMTYADDEIKAAFDSFDLDRNGYVGASELRHVLSLIGESATDAEIDEMIAMCDPDGDGQASFPAFRALFSEDPHNIDFERKGPGPKPPKASSGAIAGGVSPTAGSQGLDSMTKIMEGFTGGTKLKPAYIKKVYKKFQAVDQDGSGRIEYPEFLAVMEQKDSYLMKRMFDVFDADKSGSIELKEFIVGLSNYTGSNQISKLQFAFLMFDEDQSGFIDHSELLNILRANFPDAAPGVIQEKANTILESMGLSKSDPASVKISYEQFMTMAKRNMGLIFPAYQMAGNLDDALMA